MGYSPDKCYPKKKFCKCRSSSPRPPTGGPTSPPPTDGPTGSFTPTLISGGTTEVTQESTTSFFMSGVEPYIPETDSGNSTESELAPADPSKEELTLIEKLSRMVQSIM